MADAMNPTIERMSRTLAAQRAAFMACPYPSLAERKEKLRAIKRSINSPPRADV